MSLSQVSNALHMRIADYVGGMRVVNIGLPIKSVSNQSLGSDAFCRIFQIFVESCGEQCYMELKEVSSFLVAESINK